MPVKATGTIASVLLMGFVIAGDRILPQPLSGYSVTMRTTVLGWLPQIKQQNYNSKTEEKVNELNP